MPGTSVVIVNLGSTGVGSHSTARADGDAWFAVEEFNSIEESQLTLRWYSNELFEESRTMSAFGNLRALSQMFTPVMTWSGADKVSVLVKADLGGSDPSQYEVASIGRDNLALGTISYRELIEEDENEHGRGDLVWNEVTELRHACWTRRHPTDTGDDDDIMAKIRTGSTWPRSSRSRTCLIR